MAGKWNGWQATVYDKNGTVFTRERHRSIRDLADELAGYVGKQIIHIHPGLSPDQKQEFERRVFKT